MGNPTARRGAGGGGGGGGAMQVPKRERSPSGTTNDASVNEQKESEARTGVTERGGGKQEQERAR